MTAATAGDNNPSSMASSPRLRSLGRTDSLGRDLYQGILGWAMWSTIGWNDIRQRYRRSVFGPLWITLSMGILAGSLGLIYSQVFQMELKSYLPFVCLGFIIWGFISGSATESCIAFVESEAVIKQIKLPFSVYILRVVWRNFLVFLHTLIIFIPIALIFGVELNIATLLAVPGLLLIYLNVLWAGFVLAILSTRFRDVPLIVTNLLQLAFFGTPILWPASTLSPNTLIAEINPLYHLIEIVRTQLLGSAPALASWFVTLGLVIIGWLLTAALFRRASRRIVYWL